MLVIILSVIITVFIAVFGIFSIILMLEDK